MSLVGRILAGRYRMESQIGSGGMALVYRAVDIKTDHYVAIKILRPELMNNAEFAARFEREAEAAKKMVHHNIVNLLDVGAEEDFRYLVMEYVPGGTLKNIIEQKGALPEQYAAQIAIRILSALQHAHSHQIIHRDIKPQNVMVDEEGHVKVGDFGIARVANHDTLSQDDKVLGSVYYISPEQANGAETTFASDLYSVGVVMYEMMTGRVPFNGDTPVSIAVKHMAADPVLPCKLNPAISPAMQTVILKAMSKKPEDRYHSAAEMAIAIHDALSDPSRITEQITTTLGSDGGDHGGGRRPSWMITVGVTSVVLLALVLGGILIVNTITNSTEAPYVIGRTQAEARRLCRDRGLRTEIVRQSDEAQAGQVIAQSHEYGDSMRRGDVIVLTVSTGPEEQPCPNLVGRLIAAAAEEAETYGFSVLATESVESEQALNTVLGQTPAAGEPLVAGSIIQVTVSGSINTPDFTGLTLAEAENLARTTGFTQPVEVKTQTTQDAARYNRVADQLPKAKERVLQSTQLTLLVYVPLDEENTQ